MPNRATHRDLHDLPYAGYLTAFEGSLADEGTYDSVHLDGLVLDEPRAGRARFIESAFSGVTVNGGRMRRTRFNDVWLSAVRLVGTDLAETTWLDAEVVAGSWAGVEAFSGELRRVRFVGCKLDSVNFRDAALHDVEFVDCLLRAVDLGGAKLTGVSFEGTTLDDVRLRGATLSAVDLRGASRIGISDGAQWLRGATISSPQLIDLAQELAAAVGVVVSD